MFIALSSIKSTLNTPALPDTTCLIGNSTVMGRLLISDVPFSASQPEYSNQSADLMYSTIGQLGG